MIQVLAGVVGAPVNRNYKVQYVGSLSRCQRSTHRRGAVYPNRGGQVRVRLTAPSAPSQRMSWRRHGLGDHLHCCKAAARVNALTFPDTGLGGDLNHDWALLFCAHHLGLSGRMVYHQRLITRPSNVPGQVMHDMARPILDCSNRALIGTEDFIGAIISV